MHLNLPTYVPFPLVDAVCRGPLPSSWAHPSSDIPFPGEAGGIPLFLDHSGLLCLIHGLVSPVESGVGAPRTISLWQMPEKQKGGRDWKASPLV